MTNPIAMSSGPTNRFHSVARATTNATNGTATTRTFVMRTARLMAALNLPEQGPRQLAADRRDLGHGGAHVRGAARGDLVIEIGHVGAVVGEADRDCELALLVEEIQMLLDVGGGESRSGHRGHPVRWWCARRNVPPHSNT